MTDWTGTGTPITAATTAEGCVEYITVQDVQDEFSDDVDEMTDAQIQRRIDRLVGILEDQLGHTFGRAMIARSSDGDTVQVTATGVIIGGDTYLFATYTTLGALAAAINAAAGENYRVELLPKVSPATPSDLLKTLASSAIGPDYEDRKVLCLSYQWVKLSGDGTSHLFLPLPLYTVNEVIENLTTLGATAYWAVAGESWLIRKLCTCATSTNCMHPRGEWSNWYPGNITVEYTPACWVGGVPGSLKAALLEAFEAQANLGPFESENFGEYSYRRAVRRVDTWRDVLGGSAVRQYAVQWAP